MHKYLNQCSVESNKPKLLSWLCRSNWCTGKPVSNLVMQVDDLYFSGGNYFNFAIDSDWRLLLWLLIRSTSPASCRNYWLKLYADNYSSI